MLMKRPKGPFIQCKLMFLGFTAIMLCLWMGCSKFNEFLEHAPIEDGAYLSYAFDNGTWVSIEFSEKDSNQYHAAAKNEYEDEETSEIESSTISRVLVDRNLKKENGYPYDAEVLGPLWTPPSSIKEGGTIHGTYIDAIKKWEMWNVGVIKASFGRGAITGTWYYDQKTGFLVGGHLTTVIDEKGESFVLDDSNIGSLMPQSE
jgi:hypothetical protein